MNLSDPILQTFAPLAVLLAIFYFLVFRPQQLKVKQHQQMIAALKRGDTVVTAGGEIGRVVKVKDDSEILVEIAEGVQVRVVRGTLIEVRAKGTDTNDN